MFEKAKSFGYDGVEIACWGDHFDVEAALNVMAIFKAAGIF
jgi:sugar phosphate isomerase/epimerase